uniref:Uncharacterized protein n=1 Tax=Chelonoidis abingdonii TaxID=106734 RepID=A0A8C0GPS8_CHEAB
MTYLWVYINETMHKHLPTSLTSITYDACGFYDCYWNNTPLNQLFLLSKLWTIHKSLAQFLPEITKEDDALWPQPDTAGQQELEIVIGDEHISFTTSKIRSLIDVNQSKVPEGVQVFDYLVQDLKCLVFSLIGLHFKIKPI